jgi:uncharacterized spore protein YtfJ
MTTRPPEGLDSASGDDLLRALAERVGGSADARMVYGEPVERDGVTIVPVAQVRWGFGIGSGFRENPLRTGGGGAVASPVGYLELTASGCQYVPIKQNGVGPGVGVAALLAVARLLGRRHRG